MTAGLPYHVHISEREADGSWEDCTWDSGLEWYRDCFDPSKPATHAEAQLLRKASGEPATGGSNLGNLADGIKARYGKTIPARISNKDTLTHLKPGMAGVVQGSMSAFGPTHRLSQFDRNFDGGHAVYIANVGGTLYWCDPEAPTSADVPVVVSAAEVTKFVNAFGGQSVIAPLLVKEAATVANLTSYLPGYTATIKKDSNVRVAPDIQSAKVRTTTADEPAVVVGTVKGDVDPANGSDVWYELFKNGKSEYTAKDNILNLKPPVAATPAPTYPDLSKDLAAAKAALTAEQAKTTAQAATIADLKTKLTAALAKVAELQPIVDATNAYKTALKNFYGN